VSTVVDVLARLRADISDMKKGFKEADNIVAASGKKLKSMGDSTSDVGKKMSRNLTLPMLAAGGGAIKMANDFNGAMANVGTLIPGNTERVLEMKKAIQLMAKDTGKATGDLADGLYQTVSAFGDTAESVMLLETNAKAAVAGLASTTDAINLTSAVTKAYGDTSAKAVAQAADLALMTVRLGQTTFPELASSIGAVTPLANELGISQEQLFGTMAAFTGVTGGASEVATQMRSAMMGLMNPTEQASEAFKKAGFESAKAAIEHGGLQGAMKMLTDEATASGKPLAEFIGRVEGQTLALAGAGDLAEDWTSKTAQMGDVVGTTAIAFGEATNGVNKTGFALQQAKQRAAVMTQQVGDALGPALISLMEAATPLIEKFEGLVTAFAGASPEMQKMVIGGAALVAGLGPLLFVGGKVASVAGSMMMGFGKFSGALKLAAANGSAAARVLGLASKVAFGPWGIAIALVVGGLIWAYNNVEWFRDGVQAAMKWVGEAFSAVWDVVSAVWKGQLNPFIQKMIDGWTSWFSSMSGDFSATWAAIVSYATVAWATISTVVKTYLAVLMALWNTFGPAIMAQMTNVWNVVKGVISGAMEYIRSYISVVMALVRGDWSAVWEGIKGMLSGIWTIITALLTGAMNTVKNLMAAGWAAIKAVAGAVWAGIKSVISSAWEGIKNLLAAAWENMKNTAKAAWAAFKQLIHDAILGAYLIVTRGIPAMIQWFKDLPGKIKSALATLWGALVGTLQRAWDGLVRIITRGIPAAVAWFAGLPSKIVSALSSLASKMKEVISNAVGKMKDGAVSAWPKVLAYFTAFPGNLLKGIGRLTTLLWTTGKNIITGLWNGLKSMKDWVKGKVKGFIKEVVPDVVQKALGISSPSKVMAEMGVWAMKGLTEGIKDGGTDAARATLRVIDSIKDQAEDLPRFLVARAKRAEGWLDNHIDQLEVLNGRISDAESNLRSLGNERSQFQESATASFSGSIFGSDESATGTSGMLDALRAQLATAKKFRKDMDAIMAAGASDEVIKRVTEAGPAAASQLAALAASGKGVIEEMNSLQAQVLRESNDIGSLVAGSLYDAGVAAAEGLVEGMLSQKAYIEGRMTAIGGYIKDGIETALGIKSPSRVMAAVGKFVSMGLAVGMTNGESDVVRAAEALTRAATPRVNTDFSRSMAFGGAMRKVTPEAVRSSPSQEQASMVGRGGRNGMNERDIVLEVDGRMMARILGVHLVDDARLVGNVRSG
jgi:TP901 family phage tail tape measure protein